MALLPEFTDKDSEGIVKPRPKRSVFQPTSGCAKVDSWIPMIPGMYIITYMVRDDDDDAEVAPASPVSKFDLKGELSQGIPRSSSKGRDLEMPDSGPELYGPLASHDKTVRTFHMRGSRHRLSVKDLQSAFKEDGNTSQSS